MSPVLGLGAGRENREGRAVFQRRWFVLELEGEDDLDGSGGQGLT